MCHVDTDTNLAIYLEDRGQTQNEGYINSTDNFPST